MGGDKATREELRRANAELLRENAEVRAQIAALRREAGLDVAAGEKRLELSERRWALNAVRESEAIFKTAFMLVPDACYVATLENGLVLEVNKAFEHLLGHSREDVIGRTSKDLDIWVDYDDRLLMRDQLRTAGFVRQIETRGKKKSGEYFDCSASASIVKVSGVPCVVGVLRDITERKRAEQAVLDSRQALADSQEALLALMDSTNDLIWSVDPRRFGLLRFNKALYNYFARAGIECGVGMDPAELKLPPPFVAKWHERYGRALSEGPFVEEYIPFPGRPVLELSLNLVKRGDEVVAISVFAKDITERKEAEEALRQSEERFRASIEDAPVAIGLSREGRILYVNRKCVELYGFQTADQMVGLGLLDLWTPDDRAELMARGTDLTAGRQVSVDFEGVSIRKDGTRFATHVAVGAVQLSDGRALIGYMTDITDRKRAEAALRESEERFRQVAESVSDFIWEVNPEGVYTYTSPAVEQILGYKPHEMVGRMHFYDLFAEDVRDELKVAALEAFAARQPFRAFPNRNVSKDGRTVYLETSGVPLVDEAGTLRGYRGADSDVTERWLAEQSVRDLSGRLINAQEAERSRLGRELHDHFCQSLALLAVQLDRLGQGPPESVDVLRERLERLRQNVTVLSAEVRQLSHDLHPGRLEQLGLTAAVRGLCKDVGAAHALAVGFGATGVPRDLRDDIALCLYRVAQEALQNVVKHSGAASARVELASAGGELRLVVTDDGCGFDVAASRAPDSVGLGLANMRERVRFVSDRLAIECPAGGGTRVEARVPLGAVPAAIS